MCTFPNLEKSANALSKSIRTQGLLGKVLASRKEVVNIQAYLYICLLETTFLPLEGDPTHTYHPGHLSQNMTLSKYGYCLVIIMGRGLGTLRTTIMDTSVVILGLSTVIVLSIRIDLCPRDWAMSSNSKYDHVVLGKNSKPFKLINHSNKRNSVYITFQ